MQQCGKDLGGPSGLPKGVMFSILLVVLIFLNQQREPTKVYKLSHATLQPAALLPGHSP